VKIIQRFSDRYELPFLSKAFHLPLAFIVALSDYVRCRILIIEWLSIVEAVHTW
jgi:hypothetical protein